MNKYKEICEYCPEEKIKICTGGNIANTFKTMIKNIESEKIAISLSGGVDSMISSWLLKQICKKSEIFAIHINYNNRISSIQEMEFVKEWCQEIDLECKIINIEHLRRININDKITCYENNKEICRREYEEKTKNIRFSAYEDLNCRIVLGHNKDDLIENIITNICNNKLKQLGGMKKSSIINNVHIERPMLNISKQEIYDYAKRTNIPYLNDSTPAWSRRGKLRDSFVPIIKEIEPNFINGLHNLLEQNKLL